MSVPLGIAFEAGTGAGFVRFSDRDGEIDFSATKWIVQPIRLTYKPLAPFGDSTRWDALQFALNAIVFASLRDDDFGAQGNMLSGYELVWQPMLRVDVFKLVRPKDRPRR
jgi:hypothetical protein